MMGEILTPCSRLKQPEPGLLGPRDSPNSGMWSTALQLLSEDSFTNPGIGGMLGGWDCSMQQCRDSR